MNTDNLSYSNKPIDEILALQLNDTPCRHLNDVGVIVKSFIVHFRPCDYIGLE